MQAGSGPWWKAPRVQSILLRRIERVVVCLLLVVGQGGQGRDGVRRRGEKKRGERS